MVHSASPCFLIQAGTSGTDGEAPAKAAPGNMPANPNAAAPIATANFCLIFSPILNRHPIKAASTGTSQTDHAQLLRVLLGIHEVGRSRHANVARPVLGRTVAAPNAANVAATSGLICTEASRLSHANAPASPSGRFPRAGHRVGVLHSMHGGNFFGIRRKSPIWCARNQFPGSGGGGGGRPGTGGFTLFAPPWFGIGGAG